MLIGGDSMPAGELAEWLSAIGTVGSLALGVWLVGREAARRRNRQSRLISAWATEVHPQRSENDWGTPIASLSGASSIEVTARNGSESPVYDFTVTVHHDYSSTSGSTASEVLILPPGQTVVWVDFAILPPGGLAGLPRVSASFTDENGVRWKRYADGSIHKVKR